MNIIGQPENYSQMLRSIFFVTFGVSAFCTSSLAKVSPQIQTFFESWAINVSLGPFDSVKALYLFVPLAITIFARAILLHDRISDLFQIRKTFDIKYILRPLVDGAGFQFSDIHWAAIKRDRHKVMRTIFYRYASFRDPKIDVQLVRSSADRWTWFWCAVEPSVIILLTGIIFAFLQEWSYFGMWMGIFAVFIFFAIIQWPSLKRNAANQIDEILSDKEKKEGICIAFTESLSLNKKAHYTDAINDNPKNMPKC